MIAEPHHAEEREFRGQRRRRWRLDWVGYRRRRKQEANRLLVRRFWRIYLPLIGLFLIFIGCWEATRRWGVKSTLATLSERRAHASEVPTSQALSVLPIEDPGAILPFVVSITHAQKGKRYRCLYLWLFGAVVDTPFQWNLDLELLPPDDLENI